MTNFNARVLAESDLKYHLEREWKLPVILVAPDGTEYDKSANEPTEDLGGQVMYDTLEMDPETGNRMIVHNPVVTLRTSSLARVPAPGEKWMIKIPVPANPTAPKETFFFSLPPEGGSSHSFIRLYCTKNYQTPP